MLAFAKVAWEQFHPDDGRWGECHDQTLRELTSGYYTNRVRNLLNRSRATATSEDEYRYLVWYITTIFLNKHSHNALRDLMPPAFNWAGLYDMNTLLPQPVCPAVIVGISNALCDPVMGIIKFLADHPGTCRTALKLFVEGGLRNSVPKVHRVSCTNLKVDMKAELVWRITNVRIQSQQNPHEAVANVEDGTLIICVAGHVVIDMVLYDNASVYFLQISMQSYVDHSTTFDDLYTTMLPFDPSQSVGAYYSSKAPTAWNIPQYYKKFTDSLAQKVKYVYITPDVTKHRMKTKMMEHVLRVGGVNLQTFGTLEYTSFVR